MSADRVSGMAAQANRLSTVSDNIANSSTTGYTRASTEFSSLVLESAGSAYESDGAWVNNKSPVRPPLAPRPEARAHST